MKKKTRKYPVYDFIAALAFVFDVDWDSEYPEEEPVECVAARPRQPRIQTLPKKKRQLHAREAS